MLASLITEYAFFFAKKVVAVYEQYLKLTLFTDSLKLCGLKLMTLQKKPAT